MGSKKVRVYDLAKELKIDNKKAIEEIRREGVDVSVPSNSVPDDVAERIRNKYFPKKHVAPAAPRLIKHKPTGRGEESPAAQAQAPAMEPEVEETPVEPTSDAGDDAGDQKLWQPRVLVKKTMPEPQVEHVEVEPVFVMPETELVEETFAEVEEPAPVVETPVVVAKPVAPEPKPEPTSGFRVRQLPPPPPRPVPPPPRAAVEAPSAQKPAGTTVRVLTRKPGASAVYTPPPPPPPVSATTGSLEAAGDAGAGPVKLPENRTYIPPKTDKRPGGMRRHKGGNKKGRDQGGRTDRAGASDGRQPQQPRSFQAAVAARRPVFTELKAIKLVEGITVKEFAEKLEVKPKDLVAALLGRRVMATINQTLNPDVAKDIAQDFGFDITFVPYEEMVISNEEDAILESGSTGTLESRASVVTVMGHVDHGKTSLLDAIRSARVAEGEAGGITQHISAFSVDISDPDDRSRQRRIVFIDTPGHEAFTMMRARGAKVTDVVVLVVAADDGVMPQTIEAIDHAKAADVPIIVAINKIDKPDANPDRVKQELTEHGLLWDGWGGDTVMVEISAKQKINLDSLLEMIVLTSDLKELTAAKDRLASGVVLDAFLDKGRGAVASVLIQNGTLKVGDPFIVGPVWGRVRAMFDDRGQPIEIAEPSTPIQVLGSTGVPHAGDVFQAVDDLSEAQHIASFRQSKQRIERIAQDTRRGLDSLFADLQQGQVKELQIILKADVQGSVEAVKETLNKLSTDKVKIRVVHSGVGAINESDVMLASAANKDMNRAAVIIGFNVRPDSRGEELARNEGVDIRLHTIIYKVQEEIRDAMLGMLDKAKREVMLGHADIRDVIRVPKVGNVAGCMVTDGQIKRGSEARLYRDNVVIYTGKIESLRRFKEDVSEVKSGFECGITLDRYQDIRVGDVIEAYKTEEVAQTEL